jgi:hypothetical protein
MEGEKSPKNDSLQTGRQNSGVGKLTRHFTFGQNIKTGLPRPVCACVYIQSVFSKHNPLIKESIDHLRKFFGNKLHCR